MRNRHSINAPPDLCALSPWPSVRLRIIKAELAPLIEAGCSLTFMLGLLAPLGITRRRDTLRAFIREEFPAEYARYYARQGRRTPQRERDAPVSVTPPRQPMPTRPVTERQPDANPLKPKLGVERLLDQLGNFQAGTHLHNHEAEDTS